MVKNDGGVQHTGEASNLSRAQLLAIDLEAVKLSYGERFVQLRTIVNQHDPVRLLSLGAPEDEYEPEVKTMIVQLSIEMTEAEVHDLVYQEFLSWFGTEAVLGPKDAYRSLASAIYHWQKGLEEF